MSLVKVPVPWRGMNLSAEGDSLESGEGVLLRNVIPGRKGRLLQRGGMSVGYSPLGTGSDSAFNGGGGFWISPDPNGSGVLSMAAGATVSRSGAAAFALPGTVNYITPSHARLNTYTVGVTAGTTNQLMTWNGTSTCVLVSTGPLNVEACVSHLARIFTVDSTGGLKWTDPNPDLTTNSAATWQDDVTGLTNLIQLPKGEWYHDLAVYNRVLYIFSQRSVYALLGDSPSNFTVRKVLEVGHGPGTGSSLAGHSAATPRGLYFYSQDGISRFDGVSAVTVSGPVDRLIRGSRWVRMESVGSEIVSVVTAGYWLIYHEPTGAWATVTCGAFPASTIHGAAGLPTHVRTAGASWTAFCTGAGSTAGATVGPLGDCFGESLSGGNVSVDYSQTTVYPIDAQAVSASIRLSGPDRAATLQRLYAQCGSGAWTVQAEDEAGGVIGSAVTVIDGAERGRAQGDLFSQRDIVRLRWTANLAVATTYNGLPSVGDAYLKVAAAQQR